MRIWSKETKCAPLIPIIHTAISKIDKTAEIKCAEDDIECQAEKVEKIGLNKTVRS